MQVFVGVVMLSLLTSIPALAVGSSQPYGRGGWFEQFNPIVRQYNQSGEEFRIEGHCQSACTMFLGIRNVCIVRSARLLFHAGHDRQCEEHHRHGPQMEFEAGHAIRELHERFAGDRRQPQAHRHRTEERQQVNQAMEMEAGQRPKIGKRVIVDRIVVLHEQQHAADGEERGHEAATAQPHWRPASRL